MKQLNWYQIFGESHRIPDGRTVTPTDNIQIWLHCADIWDKTYTTLVEVLADTSTLVMLMSIDNAVDYLVRSTTLAGLCDSETAMKAIGASDYASTTLLSDSTWNNAIQNSAYFESVDNVKIPLATGYTVANGVCLASSERSGYYAWYPLDGSSESTHIWTPSNQTGDSWWQFKFNYPVNIKKIVSNQYSRASGNWAISYSADGVDFTNKIAQGIFSGTSTDYDINAIANINTNADYYRWEYTSMPERPLINNCQFYGRVNGGVLNWLRSAGITDKSYITLAEVLADTTTLATLMANHNAVDYLVTCKGWTTTICADANAMSYIGQNNYCANTLLADETWKNAICTSTYFESVLNVKVPKMTSNTTPEGECFVLNAYGGQPAYVAFDRSSASVIVTSNYTSVVGWYVGYYFPEEVKIYKMNCYISQTEGRTENITVTIQATKDRSVWTNLTENVPKTIGSFNGDIISTKNIDNYIGYRFYSYGRGVRVMDVQFYGRKDV